MKTMRILSLFAGLTLAIATIASAANDILIADFEAETYGDWKAAGEAFGPGPVPGRGRDQGVSHIPACRLMDGATLTPAGVGLSYS